MLTLLAQRSANGKLSGGEICDLEFNIEVEVAWIRGVKVTKVNFDPSLGRFTNLENNG